MTNYDASKVHEEKTKAMAVFELAFMQRGSRRITMADPSTWAFNFIEQAGGYKVQVGTFFNNYFSEYAETPEIIEISGGKSIEDVIKAELRMPLRQGSESFAILLNNTEYKLKIPPKEPMQSEETGEASCRGIRE